MTCNLYRDSLSNMIGNVGEVRHAQVGTGIKIATAAPKGQTPILQHHFNWSQLSVIAGITFRRFYFRLFPGAIKGPQIIEFLHALGQQIRQPLLVIWDGLAAHRSALVRDYLEALNGAVQIEHCPPMHRN